MSDVSVLATFAETCFPTLVEDPQSYLNWYAEDARVSVTDPSSGWYQLVYHGHDEIQSHISMFGSILNGCTIQYTHLESKTTTKNTIFLILFAVAESCGNGGDMNQNRQLLFIQQSVLLVQLQHDVYYIAEEVISLYPQFVPCAPQIVPFGEPMNNNDTLLQQQQEVHSLEDTHPPHNTLDLIPTMTPSTIIITTQAHDETDVLLHEHVTEDVLPPEIDTTTTTTLLLPSTALLVDDVEVNVVRHQPVEIPISASHLDPPRQQQKEKEQEKSKPTSWAQRVTWNQTSTSSSSAIPPVTAKGGVIPHQRVSPPPQQLQAATTSARPFTSANQHQQQQPKPSPDACLMFSVEGPISEEQIRRGIGKNLAEKIVSIRNLSDQNSRLVFVDFSDANALKLLRENPPVIAGTKVQVQVQRPREKQAAATTNKTH